MARPSSASNASRLATSTTLIPDAAICRANSLPIPDEAPVTSAHGPNRPLSSTAFIFLFLSYSSLLLVGLRLQPRSFCYMCDDNMHKCDAKKSLPRSTDFPNYIGKGDF